MTPSTLRALCEQATPGPWVAGAQVGPNDHTPRIYTQMGDAQIGYVDYRLLKARETAAFIAACSPDLIAKLCDLWEAAKEWERTSVHAGRSTSRVFAVERLTAALAALQEKTA